jgi:hypothetical protein
VVDKERYKSDDKLLITIKRGDVCVSGKFARCEILFICRFMAWHVVIIFSIFISNLNLFSWHKNDVNGGI